MTKPGDSLNKYGSSLITASDSCVKPTGNPYDCGNYRNDTTSTAIFNCSPSVNWNSKLVPDSILANNLGCNAYTTTTSGNCDSGMDIWQILLLTCNSFPTLCSVFKFASDMFNKGDKAASDEAVADANLADSVEEAKNIDKNTSTEKLTSLSSTLGIRINTATQKLNTAKNTKETATNTISNLDENKAQKEGELATFDQQKGALELNISKLELELSKLDPNAQNYASEKTRIEAAISAAKKKLKDDYSDTKRQNITNAIDKFGKDLKEWKLTLAKAQDIIDNLPEEIKEAEKAKKKLDNEINKRTADDNKK